MWIRKIWNMVYVEELVGFPMIYWTWVQTAWTRFKGVFGHFWTISQIFRIHILPVYDQLPRPHIANKPCFLTQLGLTFVLKNPRPSKLESDATWWWKFYWTISPFSIFSHLFGPRLIRNGQEFRQMIKPSFISYGYNTVTIRFRTVQANVQWIDTD